MSTQMKLIVPLLDKAIKKEDLTEEAGLIDIYVYDKNRPQLDNHIFLVYDMSKVNKNVGQREHDLYRCKNIYSSVLEYINGKFCKIYAFNIVGNDIKKLYNCHRDISYEAKMRILGFWGGRDESVSKAILSKKDGLFSRDWKTIPEYDYCPKTIGIGQNKAGLL